MLKLTLAYLAGALTVALAAIAAGGRAATLAFAVGCFLPLLGMAGLLWSPRRLRRLALLLDRTADVFDSRPRSTRPQIVPPAKLTEPEPDSVAAMVYAWLHDNNGLKKTLALACTREALERAPGADLGELIAVASDIARKAAA